MSEELRNLGYANGWSTTPEIVWECRRKKHQPETRTVGNCLTERRCEECGYKYLVDSSG